MAVFGTIIASLYDWLTIWVVAAILGGVLILFVGRHDRRRKPSDDEIRDIARQYQGYYGAEAFQVIGGHMLAASFAPDGRHHALLKRVSAELLAEIIRDEELSRRRDAIKH